MIILLKQPRIRPTINNLVSLRYSSNRFANLYQKLEKQRERTPRKSSNSKNPSKIEPKNFQFTQGTEQAQTSIKQIISKLPNQVEVVNKNTISKSSLLEVLKSINLSQQGLKILETSKIKIVPVLEMVQSYRDELAKLKEAELIKSGSFKAMKSMKMKLDKERKKSSDKFIDINFKISINDLKTQKRKEIERALEKWDKFHIYINDKLKKMSDEEMEVEIKRKEMIKEKFELILNELQCKWELEGQNERSISYSVISNVQKKKQDTTINANSNKEDSRREKKINNGEKKVKKSVSEDELDNLYSFKIED
ncbi:unnamed protein product [Candida verbasci]|uniref:Altered inheritance of mitochondria protein 23, mitochondrial n=1 Tax=Candida verbasci TaxID=1227364 RepID=A0A9W4TUG1_9ASCO|nr:unnamed protein product [Candida verbasci]